MTHRSETVPEVSSVDVSSAATTTLPVRQSGPHDLECLIQRALQAQPGLRFARLTVHHCPQGVCLEGLLDANEDGIDLVELVNQIAGVQAINHVVTRPQTPK
jgi:hypothetical protein